MNTTHEVSVVPVALTPHPNADTLSVVQVFGYTCVVKTADWVGVERAAFVPPDSIVDTSRECFAFLPHPRVKARKFRGVPSFGVLIPYTGAAEVGDDVAEELGVTHYDPEVKVSQGANQPSRPADFSKYDIDALRGRYGAGAFTPGEPVVVTEKLHGENMRVVFDGVLRVGSRAYWREEGDGDAFWRCVTPELRALAEKLSQHVLFGEKIGSASLKYGLAADRCRFYGFDIRRPDGSYLDAEEMLGTYTSHGVPSVPMLYEGPYDFATVCELAEGKSLLADHVREGCVVTPATERFSHRLTRVKYKAVGSGYLEKAK